MNQLLKMAGKILKEAATIADAITDGTITLAEYLKYAGTNLSRSLRDFLPEPGETADNLLTFEQLSEEQLADLTAGHEVPAHVVEHVYNSARHYFLAVYGILGTLPDVAVELPKAASEKKLVDVKGIGPKLEAILINIGIKTVEHLADAVEAKLSDALAKAGVTPAQLKNVGAIIDNAKQLLENEKV